jgi:hypothetical protein
MENKKVKDLLKSVYGLYLEKDVDGVLEDCYGWYNHDDWQVILFEDGSLVILYEDLENSIACSSLGNSCEAGRLINKKTLVKKLDYIFYMEQLSPLYIRRNKVLEDLGI